MACLACYNEGYHSGRWMNKDELDTWWYNNGDPFLKEDKTALKPLCDKHLEEYDRVDGWIGDDFQMHYTITYTWESEWAIHDYEFIPTIDEHPDIPKLLEVMETIEDLGESYTAYVKMLGGIEYGNLDDYEDKYYGVKPHDPEDLAYEYVEDTGILQGVPDQVCQYFDYDLFGRHMLQEMTEIDGYLFRNY